MCRLFGLSAGTYRVGATFWLLDAPDSLADQSHRNPDGCGIAGFDPSGRVELHKAPVAAWDDPAFGSAARHLRSSTFVGHVRHASTGGRTYENTHPFAEGDVAFAHNGAFAGLDQVEGQLGEWREVVHGDTDSERMFALILKESGGKGPGVSPGDLGAGITAAVTWLCDHVPVLSLNLILVTPTDLWALRCPEANELYVLQRRPGGHHGGHHLDGVGDHGGIHVRSAELQRYPAVVVASERIDENPAWDLVAPGELVHVDHTLAVDRHVAVERAPRYPLELPATSGGH